MPTRAAHLVALLRESATYRDPNPGRDHITGQLHALRCGGILQSLHGDADAVRIIGRWLA